MLRKDKEEAEAIKHAKALEEEKAMYSVRAGGRRGQGSPQGGHTPNTLGPFLRAVVHGASGESSGRSG
jgi:hypothetical protein